MEKLTAKQYTQNLLEAFLIFQKNNKGYAFYAGRGGGLRFAREYGYGLRDFPAPEAHEMLMNSYTDLCKAGYNQKPPITGVQWYAEILEALKDK